MNTNPESPENKYPEYWEERKFLLTRYRNLKAEMETVFDRIEHLSDKMNNRLVIADPIDIGARTTQLGNGGSG